MFTLTQLTDNTIRNLFNKSYSVCFNILWSIPVIQLGKSAWFSNRFVVLFLVKATLQFFFF